MFLTTEVRSVCLPCQVWEECSLRQIKGEEELFQTLLLFRKSNVNFQYVTLVNTMHNARVYYITCNNNQAWLSIKERSHGVLSRWEGTNWYGGIIVFALGNLSIASFWKPQDIFTLLLDAACLVSFDRALPCMFLTFSRFELPYVHFFCKAHCKLLPSDQSTYCNHRSSLGSLIFNLSEVS